MDEKVGAFVPRKEVEAPKYMYAVPESYDWYELAIGQLDEPLSCLLIQEGFTPEGLDVVVQAWSKVNGEVVARIFATFSDFECRKFAIFGFLVAEFVEDRDMETVNMFFDALNRERERLLGPTA